MHKTKEVTNEGARLLGVYLDTNERTASWLARRCEVDTSLAWRWLKCQRVPTPEQRIVIEAVTGIPAQLWMVAR